MLVSSSSWTADENFSILLRSLQQYDKAAAATPSLPALLCVITGKGALRAAFEAEVSAIAWRRVHIVNVFLPASLYPCLLACADVGVCLHYSSSGLDLPMKVVDMFGCGVPVLAVRFAALPELVSEGETGFIFESDSELCAHLLQVLRDFPEAKHLTEMKGHVQRWATTRWEDAWRRDARDLFAFTARQFSSLRARRLAHAAVAVVALIVLASTLIVATLSTLGYDGQSPPPRYRG
jgi:beta-1,4-mannosyltransferase